MGWVISLQISCPVSWFHSKVPTETLQKVRLTWNNGAFYSRDPVGINLVKHHIQRIFLIFPLGFIYLNCFLKSFQVSTAIHSRSWFQDPPTDRSRRDPLCLHLWIPWDVTWSLYKILNGWIGRDGMGWMEGWEDVRCWWFWWVVESCSWVLVQYGKLLIISSFNFQESNFFFCAVFPSFMAN